LKPGAVRTWGQLGVNLLGPSLVEIAENGRQHLPALVLELHTVATTIQCLYDIQRQANVLKYICLGLFGGRKSVRHPNHVLHTGGLTVEYQEGSFITQDKYI
jgi:hypothetical protein